MRTVKDALRNGGFGNVAGIIMFSLTLLCVAGTLTERAHKNVMIVDRTILGIEEIYRNTNSFVYRKDMKDAWSSAEVYRVGDLYTARVMVVKNDRQWIFLRPATPEETRMWRLLFPPLYGGRLSIEAPYKATDKIGFGWWN